MNSKQRYSKKRDDFILRLYDLDYPVDKIVEESGKSLVHVNKLILRHRNLYPT